MGEKFAGVGFKLITTDGSRTSNGQIIHGTQGMPSFRTMPQLWADLGRWGASLRTRPKMRADLGRVGCVSPHKATDGVDGHVFPHKATDAGLE